MVTMFSRSSLTLKKEKRATKNNDPTRLDRLAPKKYEPARENKEDFQQTRHRQEALVTKTATTDPTKETKLDTIWFTILL
eukprot:scaffold11520_cov106-Amphora_coffeaeformis.AAC.2